jgi:hypothetical protein
MCSPSNYNVPHWLLRRELLLLQLLAGHCWCSCCCYGCWCWSAGILLLRIDER